jgi:hypothetical protein
MTYKGPVGRTWPAALAAFIRFRKDPANDDTTDGMWCGANNIRPEDLSLLKAQNPDWAQVVLEHRRKQYAEQLAAVDTALLEKAKAGDTKAAALLYARFENWTPRTVEAENKRTGGRTKSFADLVAEEGV